MMSHLGHDENDVLHILHVLENNVLHAVNKSIEKQKQPISKTALIF